MLLRRVKHYFDNKKMVKIKELAKQRLNLEAFLGEQISTIQLEQVNNVQQNEKIKVGLIHYEELLFNMIGPVYDVFSKDEKYDVNVILAAGQYSVHYREMLASIKGRGLQYKFDFETCDENYDILFVFSIHMEPNQYILQMVNRAKYVFAVPTNEYQKEFPLTYKNQVMKYKPLAMMTEKFQADYCQKYFDIPFFATGNPKYDMIYSTFNSPTKLCGNFSKYSKETFKKTFLLITDHNGSFKPVCESVSFDLYAKTIFDFFHRHQDCCLIFRPFGVYIDENVRQGLWTDDDVRKFKAFCKQSNNIIWDDSDDYSLPLKISDAIISDVDCGITTSSLVSNMPICIPLRWDMDCSSLQCFSEEKDECYYYAHSEKDMLTFLDNVYSDIDPKRETRIRFVEKYYSHFDGEIANRIKTIIENEYLGA